MNLYSWIIFTHPRVNGAVVQLYRQRTSVLEVVGSILTPVIVVLLSKLL